MKFNYIVSDTTLGGHKALFGVLREQNDGKNRHIFVVPDRFTLGVEREICEALYPDGTFNVDVCSFTRMAQKALGKKNRACLSKEGTVLLLNRIIRENNDSLGYYKDVKSVAFSREMFASIASLRSSGISSERVEEKGKLIGGTVGEKLKDIALLYKAYESTLVGEYFDTITRVDWLIRNLASAPYVRDSHIYILGFNVFSEQQTEFIKRAMLLCPSVSVAFCASDGENAPSFPTSQRDALYEYAVETGVPVSERRLHEVLPPTFDFLHRTMFSFGKATYAGNASDDVKVCGYPDAYEEIKSLAREIRYLVFDRGYRYKDIAVVCNDESYNPIVRKTFSRYGIPYFIDEKYAVNDGFLARYVRAILAASDSDLDLRDVLPVAHHPFSGFTREQTQRFEKACVLHNANHLLLLRPFAEDAEAESVRVLLIARITSVPKSGTFRDFCAWIENLAGEESIVKAGETLSERGDVALVYADNKKFLGVVREIADLMGDRETTLEEFADTLWSVTENMTVSVLPQFLDTVFVGNTTESRFSDIKVMFVAGASDGFFPKVAGDKLILGSYDALVMKNNGLRVFPSPEETNFFEQFEVIDLLSKTQKLYVSYATSAFDGTFTAEGSAVREIKFRLRLPEQPFASYYYLTENDRLVYEFATPENCYYEYTAGRIPATYEESVRAFLTECGYLEKEDERQEDCNLLDGYLRTDAGAYKLSVSKMETYFKCPFKNFLKNVVGLQEKEESSLKVNDKGKIMHAALEKYFGVGKKLREMTEQERSAHAEKCINEALSDPEYARFAETPAGRREMNDIKKRTLYAMKALTGNMLHSAFTPFAVEKYFSGNEITFTVGEDTFSFSGIIDRVDGDDTGKIVIIDYKTGGIDDSLATVYSGEKIQLYVYLRYYMNRGYTPAGVFYAPVPDGYSAKGISFAMKGQIRKGADTFVSMDDRVLTAENGKYESPAIAFSAKKTENGVEEGGTNKKNMLTEDDFAEIVSYVERVIVQAVREIREGYREKKPVKDGCEYCPYRTKICGDVPEREEVVVTTESFRALKEES